MVFIGYFHINLPYIIGDFCILRKREGSWVDGLRWIGDTAAGSGGTSLPAWRNFRLYPPPSPRGLVPALHLARKRTHCGWFAITDQALGPFSNGRVLATSQKP